MTELVFGAPDVLYPPYKLVLDPQPRRVVVSLGSAALVGDVTGPRVKLFHRLPSTPTFPYESCRDALLAACSSLSGRFRAWRLAYRWVADDLRRP